MGIWRGGLFNIWVSDLQMEDGDGRGEIFLGMVVLF